MNKQYDFIYLTNTPSFYKVRLCEELAKKHSVLLVLYGYGAEAVNTRLSGNENGFDYFFLHEGDAGKRNKALVLFRLLKLMARVRARRVLFSGWMAPEYNIYSFLSSKRRNAVICESSAIDSGMDGWKGLLKKAVIRRMSAALPSGSPHRALFEHIRYPGDIHVTGSVGIFNMEGRRALRHSPSTPLNYIYVGRLAPEKNLPLTVRAFKEMRAQHPRVKLVMVGDGPMRQELESQNADFHFAGVRTGIDLAQHYASADVFLFPSLSETFGNVTLEALASGLCVLAYRCAAAEEVIRHGDNGLVVTPGDEAAFIAQAAALVRDEALRSRIRERASPSVAAHDWTRVHASFASALRGAVTEAQASDPTLAAFSNGGAR